MTFENPLARPGRRDVSAQIRRLKEAARAALGLGEDVMVSVTELTCHEPGCPDVETVVAILRPGEPPRLARIHKPLRETSPEDVAAACSPSAG